MDKLQQLWINDVDATVRPGDGAHVVGDIESFLELVPQTGLRLGSSTSAAWISWMPSKASG